MALALRKEEGFGLGIAIIAHAALVAVLLLRPHSAPVVQPPERMTVTISDEVGLTSTSPQPNSQAAQSVAPTLGEAQEEPQAEAQPETQPEARPEPSPAPPEPAPPKPTPPKPKPTPPQPKATPRPTSRPVQQRPAPKPPTPAAKPKPQTRTPAAPAKAPARPAPPRSAPSKAAARPSAPKAPARPVAPSGGSRIGSDFLSGITGGSGPNRASTAAPAAAIGPAVKASLSSAIARQLKPKWQAPQGPDAEELVTILSFNLNRDGTLAGPPQVVRQQGINDLNRNQAQRHAEQAVRAVRLAAPFDLPPEYYDAWKRVSAFRFDKRLSQ